MGMGFGTVTVEGMMFRQVQALDRELQAAASSPRFIRIPASGVGAKLAVVVSEVSVSLVITLTTDKLSSVPLTISISFAIAIHFVAAGGIVVIVVVVKMDVVMFPDAVKLAEVVYFDDEVATFDEVVASGLGAFFGTAAAALGRTGTPTPGTTIFGTCTVKVYPGKVVDATI